MIKLVKYIKRKTFANQRTLSVCLFYPIFGIRTGMMNDQNQAKEVKEIKQFNFEQNTRHS